MSAERTLDRLLRAASVSRAGWVTPMHPAVGSALADLLAAEWMHVASHECAAHCEPDGCAASHKAFALSDAILGSA